MVPRAASLSSKERRETRFTAGRRKILIRRLTPDNEVRLLGTYSRLSLQTIYRRFHTPFPEVPGWMIVSFAKADPCHVVSVVAVVGEDIVGHAMYARSENGSEAEFAIVVEDGWQSKGVGKLLLSELATEARRQSIDTFTAVVLAENERVFGLIDSVFAGARRSFRDGSYDVRVPLQSLKPVTILKPLASIGP